MAAIAKIIATAGVRLQIDKRGLAREIRDTVRDALSGERGSFEVDADTAAARRELASLTEDRRMRVVADLDVRDLERRLKNVGGASRAVVGSLLSADLWRIAGRGVVSYGAAVAAVTPVVAQLGAGLLEASQAAAVLPAALAGSAAVIGTLVVGMQGVGTALDALGDAEKFAEALKDLSSEARATVKELDRMRPGFRELRLNTQNALFRGLDKTIGRLGRTALPRLRTGLEDIATELNDGFQLWADWARQQGPMRDLTRILDNTGKAVGILGPAGRDFAAAMTDIAAVGSDFLPLLARSAADAASNFREFIRDARESGRLREFIQDGIDAFGDLLVIVRNVGSIIGSVFRGLSGQSGGFLNNVREITDRWREFLRSSEGQEGLATVGQTLSTIGSVLRNVLGAALREFGPILKEVLPALTEFARVLSEILVAAIETVAPLLRELAAWAGGNANWLGPLAAGAVALSLALRGLRAPIGWVLRNLPKIGGRAGAAGAAAGGLLAVGAAAGNGPKGASRGISLLGRATRGFVKSGGPLVLLSLGLDAIQVGTNKAGEAISAMDVILSSAGAGASGLAAALSGNGEAMRNAERDFDDATGGMFEDARRVGSVRDTFQDLNDKVGSIETFRAQEEMKNLDAVIAEFGKEGLERLQFLGEDIDALGRKLREETDMREQSKAWSDWFALVQDGSQQTAARSIGEFLRARQGIGGSLDALSGKSETVLSGIESNFRGLGATARGTSQGISRDGLNAFVSVGNTARNVGKSTETVFERINSAWRSTSAGIGNSARRNLPTIGASARSATGVANRAFADAAAGARSSFGQIAPAARKGAGDAAGAFRGIGGRIAASIGNLSSVGASIAAQLAAGMRSGIGGVGAAAVALAAAARRKMPSSPAKEGPFSGRGYPLLLGRKLSDDFAAGMRAGIPAADRAARDMAQTVRDYLPSSPAKKGALKGKGYPLLAGQTIVKELAKGLRGNYIDVRRAMNELTKRIVDSGLRGRGLLFRVQKAFEGRGGILSSLLPKRSDLTRRIDAAEKELERLLDLRTELRDTITGRALDARDLFGLDLTEGFNAAEVSTVLRASLNQLLEFQADVQSLIRRGFNRDLVQQIASAGPEAGAAMADALAKATPQQIAEINKSFSEIGKTADSFGSSISGQMFNAGVNAARGLVEGLKKQRLAIQKEMERIGSALINSIKKSLKIKSPSQEFATIGEQIMAGLVQGIEAGTSSVLSTLEGVASDMIGSLAVNTPPADLSGVGASTAAPATTATGSTFAPTYNVYAQPGMDVQQLASRVYQRGMIDYRNVASTLSVSRGAVQNGVNDQLAEGVRL